MTPEGSAPGQGKTTLVLGGARSGKSLFAEQLVAEHAGPRLYIATAQARDDEMQARIVQHRQRRGADWQTREVPLDLAAALDALSMAVEAPAAVLVDCLTLWLSNHMLAEHDIAAECGRLCTAIAAYRGPLVLVSSEVGLGIVPDNSLARDFRDHAGRLHQDIAALSGAVYFVAAGLPLKMKG
ncbi:bifunctional adenosylcobinamide kinase/adenosylcobinamide-phosphate guanylyltransferase [Pseudohoeflea coraliihabitans]|uniref:Bifunctional adenosylcobalamin biosynthesis protein n=1 Tax=Pseudohoeflea coraliihabitans TaxID=2860393 RepID=A0ABS6WJW4_9HYPH|nr:bifunctional adenosylcobinamide kinase/adenosylcobinamide-phosphate guanylyltransferase [Pseudohoeflea sp. DP4N28-3]MBW3095757.1 bifunctional adenosylcobinamide kinase/adenosylcobinamide-phosphate guanylyltransferase [Pseudohoeflea sp. DP4N28-3]